MPRFRTGDIVQHFKRRMLTEEQLKENPTAHLYEIIGYAEHTETHESFVVYRSLYSLNNVYVGNIYVRPTEMFESPVDIQKYPDARSKYRFKIFTDID